MTNFLFALYDFDEITPYTDTDTVLQTHRDRIDFTLVTPGKSSVFSATCVVVDTEMNFLVALLTVSFIIIIFCFFRET